MMTVDNDIFFSGEDSGTGMSMQTVVQEINQEYDHVEAEIKEPTVIYMERPLRKAEYTR